MKLNNSSEIALNITFNKDWIPYNSIIISTWISEDEKLEVLVKKYIISIKHGFLENSEIISILQIIKGKYHRRRLAIH